jgi:hypothetical protein
MDLVNLASIASPTEMANGSQWYQDAGTVFIFVLLIGAFIPLIRGVRMARPTQFNGPALTGTAQVLWSRMLFGNQTWKRRFGLRVEIPGHAPYDVAINASLDNNAAYIALGIDPWHRVVQPGRIVAVQVDSANPRRVRFDFSRPLPQPGSVGPPAPSTGSMSDGAQSVFSASQPPAGAPHGPAPDYLPRQVPHMQWLILLGWGVAVFVLIVIVLNVITNMR